MSDIESMHSAHSTEDESISNIEHHEEEHAPETHEAAAAEEPEKHNDEEDTFVKVERLSHKEWVGGLNETFHFGSKKHQSIPDDLKLPIAICCLPKDKRRFVMAKLNKSRRRMPVEEDEEEKKEPIEEKKEKKHAAGPE